MTVSAPERPRGLSRPPAQLGEVRVPPVPVAPARVAAPEDRLEQGRQAGKEAPKVRARMVEVLPGGVVLHVEDLEKELEKA